MAAVSLISAQLHDMLSIFHKSVEVLDGPITVPFEDGVVKGTLVIEPKQKPRMTEHGVNFIQKLAGPPLKADILAAAVAMEQTGTFWDTLKMLREDGYVTQLGGALYTLTEKGRILESTWRAPTVDPPGAGRAPTGRPPETPRRRS